MSIGEIPRIPRIEGILAAVFPPDDVINLSLNNLLVSMGYHYNDVAKELYIRSPALALKKRALIRTSAALT